MNQQKQDSINLHDQTLELNDLLNKAKEQITFEDWINKQLIKLMLADETQKAKEELEEEDYKLLRSKFDEAWGKIN